MARTAEQIQAEIVKASAQLRKSLDALDARARRPIADRLRDLGDLYEELFEVTRSVQIGPQWPPISPRRTPRKPGR